LMVGGQFGASDPTNVAYAQYSRTLIDELGLAERVLWTGFTTPAQVSANLLASDICVLPYRDGASFRRGSFMAALIHGLPIVSTRPEVPLPELADGQNIALVPPDDAEALADKIVALAASPEQRARLGAGAAELSKLFRWDSIARKTLEVYRESGADG
jgi:glycosyltransferase involved in cell wall biosynthesis